MRGSWGLEREIGDGLGRAVDRAERKPGRIESLGTERMLNKLCRDHPNTVRETVEELARMRVGWQQISYRRALRQIVKAVRSGGPSINVPPGF